MQGSASSDSYTDGCPHIDRNDHRCGHRFRLGRIDQAFAVCMSSFHGCPMYHRLNAELEREAGEVPVMQISTYSRVEALTIHGRPAELRPTGS